MVIVVSLGRPGENFTGLAFPVTELAIKRLGLLREALPRATRVAVLWQRTREEAQLKAVQEAAGSVKIQVISLEVRNIPAIWRRPSGRPPSGGPRRCSFSARPLSDPERKRLAELALKYRLPTSFQRSAYADAGGLMAFGADIDGMWRRMAEYADRILKGAKPGDLPIEQPAKFELVVNLEDGQGARPDLPAGPSGPGRPRHRIEAGPRIDTSTPTR